MTTRMTLLQFAGSVAAVALLFSASARAQVPASLIEQQQPPPPCHPNSHAGRDVSAGRGFGLRQPAAALGAAACCGAAGAGRRPAVRQARDLRYGSVAQASLPAVPQASGLPRGAAGCRSAGSTPPRPRAPRGAGSAGRSRGRRRGAHRRWIAQPSAGCPSSGLRRPPGRETHSRPGAHRARPLAWVGRPSGR